MVTPNQKWLWKVTQLLKIFIKRNLLLSVFKSFQFLENIFKKLKICPEWILVNHKCIGWPVTTDANPAEIYRIIYNESMTDKMLNKSTIFGDDFNLMYWWHHGDFTCIIVYIGQGFMEIHVTKTKWLEQKLCWLFILYSTLYNYNKTEKSIQYMFIMGIL